MRTAKDLSNWLFSKTAEAAPAVFPAAEPGWEKVTLPHTWNAVDGQIGTPFERGAFWYVTTFEPLEQPIPGGRLYVEVGACALRGEIWVNGKKVTEHVGGYSAFRADITGYLRDDGPNVLAILADNTYSDQVYPQRADFTFYGGLYRYVRLISVPASSFSMEEHGGPGVYIDAVPYGANAEVSVKACITNPQQDTTKEFVRTVNDIKLPPLFRKDLKGSVEDVKQLYQACYHSKVVHYEEYTEGLIAGNALSGRDDMAVTVAGNDERILLISTFDNLGKGASGAAIQNMNILLGLDETTGLAV